MKKFVNILFATAVAALAMVSCQKKEISNSVENIDPVVNETSVVTFYAKDIETKTVFGELSGSSYPTLWTSDQKVRISQNEAASIEGTVVPDGTGASADFTLASPMADDGSGNYVFYAMSPSAAQVSDLSSEYHSWSVEIPASQTPSASSPDQAAQILFASYDAGASFPESVGLSFSHLTAYGKLSFTNLGLDPGETVTSVVIEAESNFVGRYRYYYADHTPNVAGDFVGYANLSSILTLITSSTSDIWFACAPVDLRSKTLTVVVATNLGSFTKEITFPADKGYFQAGRVASFTINMSGVTRVSPVVYTEVADVASLTVGSEIIITNATSTYAAGQRGSNTFLPHQAVTVSDSKISDPSSAVEVFTIGNGNIAGTYSLQGASDSKYLAWTSGSSVSSAASVTDAASWVIAISGGTTTIRNMDDNTRYLLYRSSNSRFTTYVPTTDGVSDVKIWKKTGTGSGAITAKEPVSIAITGATTAYVVDDTYEFDGTVTLTYTDLSTKVLSSSEYTVDDSAVNMSAAGSYDIEVSYNADPSITTEYTVVVSSGAPVVTYLWTLVEGDLGSTGSPASSVSKGVLSSTSSTISWSAAYTWGGASATKAFGWDTNYSRGVQIGTGNATNKCTSMSLSTTGFTAPVTKIIIGAGTASSGNATLSVSVGGTAFKCSGNESVTLNTTTTPTSYTFVGSATGTIQISITNNANKALYLKSISINND